MVDFAIDTIGAHPLDARAAAPNGRGPEGFWKAGALQPRVPGRLPVRRGQYLDQASWSSLDTDLRQAKAVWGPKVH